MKIYHHDKSNKYFLEYEDININCCVCKKTQEPLDNVLFVHRFNPKLRTDIFCSKCIYQYKTTAKIEVFNLAMITEEVPIGSILYIPTKPPLIGAMIQDVERIKSEITIDKTVHANRGESIEGAQIGDIKKIQDRDAKDKIIGKASENELIGFIKQMKIVRDEKKQIGGGKHEQIE